MPPPRRRSAWPAIRNGILFFGGLFGVAYETVFRRPPDYGLLPVFAGMLGLPAFIRSQDDDDDDLPPAVPAEPAAHPNRQRRRDPR